MTRARFLDGGAAVVALDLQVSDITHLGILHEAVGLES
jgi:hypothetical protein